jgi:hypothetical protein
MTEQQQRPVMLVILDGWGWRESNADNAVRLAHTPTFDRLWGNGPHAFLTTCGEDVGLPEGQFGNSEVGHLNIGAGRIVMQELPRITRAARDGSLATNADLGALMAAARARTGVCHLLGLVSPGGRSGQDPHRGRADGPDPRHHRRARHAAALGGGVSGEVRGRSAARCPDRDAQRAVLRHGPRQPVGARGARL